MLTAGTRLGTFEVLGLLGAGGMGEVYRARDTRLDRHVALKVLPGDMLADETARARLLREARMASRLNHPNVCTVHGFGDEEGVFYIAMELVEGQPLSTLIEGRPLPADRTARLGLQIADALAHAHEHGVVHRDLKSANVVVTPDGRAKVLDFGLARPLVARETTDETCPRSSLTGPGTFVGTLAYMAPEQLRGCPADERSDIWALGIVLFEMACGSVPFRGRTVFELSQAILAGRPAPPRGTRIPPHLSAVVARCLAKDPGERYQSAAEVRTALETAPAPRSGRTRDARSGSERSKRPASTRRRIQAIAVLPLMNLSGDPDHEYFADGMTEALIARLSRLGALRVISRTSAMRYKGSRKSLPEIASELNVDAVVEGSVARSGSRVRITAQLIRAATDTHLWAESYERDLSDVLLLQSEVARAIADEIRVVVTPEESKRLHSARKVDFEAHDEYLKGRFHWYKLSREHLDIAARYFQSALEKDPTFAPAYAGIAATWSMRTDTGCVPPLEALPKARAAAQRALELDDSLAEVHLELGNIRFLHDWDWSAAEADFRQAVRLNPGSAESHFFLADLMVSTGRMEEGAAEMQKALDSDPLSFFFHCFAGWHDVYRQRYESALDHLRRSLEIEPGFTSAHMGLWGAFFRIGDLEQARAAAATFFDCIADPELAGTLRDLPACGYEEAMGRAAALLASRTRREHVPAIRVARLFAHAGADDPALDWLERALAAHETPLVHLGVGWDWDRLRSHARFRDLLHRIGLPQAGAP